MFENIEIKIKYAAKALMILGVFGSFGLFVVVLTEISLVTGILSLLCGIASAWILSCIVYGFGELVENSHICADACAKIMSGTDNNKSTPSESIHNYNISGLK